MIPLSLTVPDDHNHDHNHDHEHDHEHDHSLVDITYLHPACSTFFRSEQASVLCHQSLAGKADRFQRYQYSYIISSVPLVPKVCQSATRPRLQICLTHTKPSRVQLGISSRMLRRDEVTLD